MNELDWDGYNARLNAVVLPEWMDHPEPVRELYVVTKNGDKYGIDGRDETFDKVYEAYDYISNELGGRADIRTFADRAGFLFDVDNRLLLDQSEDVDHHSKGGYLYFLETHEEYLANPNDYVVAYKWLSNHPAFYHRDERWMNRWITDSGLYELTTDVFKDDDGNPVVFLEHGRWEDENRTGHRYVDWRVTGKGATFEEAYINLAKRVNECFDIQGNDTDAEFEKPNWVKTLEERIEQSDDE